MATTLATGTTVIENAAGEPEIVDQTGQQGSLMAAPPGPGRLDKADASGRE
jgi:hypothetical protein